MDITKRTACVITGAQDLEPLYTLKNLPAFMGCTTESEDKDISAFIE